MAKKKVKAKAKHDRVYLCKTILALLDEFGIGEFHQALGEMLDVKKEHGGELPKKSASGGK